MGARKSTHSVQVEPITEHQLPVRNGLEGQRLEGAVDGKNEGCGVEKGSGQPVDADPVVFGAGDAALTLLERSRFFGPGCEDLTDGIEVRGVLTTEETAGDTSDDDLFVLLYLMMQNLYLIATTT